VICVLEVVTAALLDVPANTIAAIAIIENNFFHCYQA
jgi:hypothetical protein